MFCCTRRQTGGIGLQCYRRTVQPGRNVYAGTMSNVYAHIKSMLQVAILNQFSVAAKTKSLSSVFLTVYVESIGHKTAFKRPNLLRPLSFLTEKVPT